MKLRPAALSSKTARGIAAVIDLGLLASLLLPLLWLLGASGDERPLLQTLLALLWATLGASVLAVPFWLGLGATPGQLIVGARVVSAEAIELPTLPQALRRWLGLLASMLSLGLVGRFGAGGWPDQWAGTVVIRAAAMDTDRDPRDPWPDTPYPIAHWLGELSLAQSLWLNAVLWPLAAGVVIHALAAWLHLSGGWMRLGGSVLLLVWLWLLALSAWGAVGAWRAAEAYRGPRSLALAARALLVLALPALLVSATMNLAPHLVELPLLMVGRDPIGNLEAQLTRDGHRLRLQGPIGQGDGARVRRLLQAAPKLQLVELASPGGRLHEAERIAQLLRPRALQLRAVAPCDNACVVIFMAGKSRQLAPAARLGFQRVLAGPFNPWFQRTVNRELGAHYRRAGYSQLFVIKALATPPPQVWAPEGDELAAGVVTLAAQPLDVELPAFDAVQASDYVEALSTHAAWQALDRRFPGAVTTAAARMHEARVGGGDQDAVMVAGQAVIDGLLPELLSHAGPEVRQQYLALLGDQLSAAQAFGPSACRDLLAGDTALRRKLPATLARRELAWLIEVVREPLRQAPPRRLNALESEVLRRTLGERAPALLASFWRPPRPEARELDCPTALGLLAELAKLAAPERRLAMRVMFERF